MQDGGGLHSHSSTVRCNGGKIYRNTAGRSGGGLCLQLPLLVHIESFHIHDNKASIKGGGIDAQGWPKGKRYETFHMTDSSVHNNILSADGGDDPSGAGMNLRFLGEARIQRTRVADNQVQGTGNAGGMHCLDGSYSLDGLEVNQTMAGRVLAGIQLAH